MGLYTEGMSARERYTLRGTRSGRRMHSRCVGTMVEARVGASNSSLRLSDNCDDAAQLQAC